MHLTRKNLANDKKTFGTIIEPRENYIFLNGDLDASHSLYANIKTTIVRPASSIERFTPL